MELIDEETYQNVYYILAYKTDESYTISVNGKDYTYRFYMELQNRFSFANSHRVVEKNN